jgi:hypothetical protein
MQSQITEGKKLVKPTIVSDDEKDGGYYTWQHARALIFN